MVRKIAVLIGAIVIAVGAWSLIPFSEWVKLSQELSIFFGFLGAALPQAMAMTAQSHSPKRIDLAKAGRVVAALRRLQIYWLTLFVLCGIGILVLVGGKLLSSERMLGDKMIIDLPSIYTLVLPDFSLAPAFSAALSVVLALLAFNLAGLGRGIISLQNLRNEALLDEMKAAATDHLKKLKSEAAPYAAPEGYGDISTRPRASRRKSA